MQNEIGGIFTMNEGWKCPGCGSCYAPWKAKCEICGPVQDYNTVGSHIVTIPCTHEWYSDTIGTRCKKCGQYQFSLVYSNVCTVCHTVHSDSVGCGGSITQC